MIWHPFGAARSNLDGFWLARARFFTAFGSILAVFQMEWSERTFCKQWLDEQYALIAALNIAICCHIGFSR